MAHSSDLPTPPSARRPSEALRSIQLQRTPIFERLESAKHPENVVLKERILGYNVIRDPQFRPDSSYKVISPISYQQGSARWEDAME